MCMATSEGCLIDISFHLYKLTVVGVIPTYSRGRLKLLYTSIGIYIEPYVVFNVSCQEMANEQNVAVCREPSSFFYNYFKMVKTNCVRTM